MPKNVVFGLGSIRFNNSAFTSLLSCISPSESNSSSAPVYSCSPSGMYFSMPHEYISKNAKQIKVLYVQLFVFNVPLFFFFVRVFFRRFILFFQRTEQLTEFVELAIKDKS